jgi:hypothetical protein
MVRALDLQDNLSKTPAVERIAQSARQQPDLDQRAFAQQVQQMAVQQKERTEPMEMRSQVELETEKERLKERKEQMERERKKKPEKEEPRGKSGDHLIDITI